MDHRGKNSPVAMSACNAYTIGTIDWRISRTDCAALVRSRVDSLPSPHCVPCRLHPSSQHFALATWHCALTITSRLRSSASSACSAWSVGPARRRRTTSQSCVVASRCRWRHFVFWARTTSRSAVGTDGHPAQVGAHALRVPPLSPKPCCRNLGYHGAPPCHRLSLRRGGRTSSRIRKCHRHRLSPCLQTTPWRCRR